MAERQNFLLGKGESLTQQIVIPHGGGEKKQPYSLSDAKRTLAPMISAAAESLEKLPASACPNGEAVVVLTLHPEFLAKSSYPDELFKAVGLRAVGSRPVTVTPRKWSKEGDPQPSPAAEIFVAGPRDKFREFADSLPKLTQASKEAGDIIKVEEIRAVAPAEKIKPLKSKSKKPLMEVVLHAGENAAGQVILDGFESYLKKLQITIDLDKRMDAGGLSFVPVRVPKEKITEVAKFSFLRLCGEMPRLRQLRPASAQSVNGDASFPCEFPADGPLDPSIRVAVFDGGVPDIPALRKWIKRIDGRGVSAHVREFLRHGLAVTSALMFGSLEKGKTAGVPYARVDHYRVLDDKTNDESDDDSYAVLRRILAVLKKEQYEFVNFSIGPDIPLDDDDVHPWTAKLDPLLSSGNILATIAVGNSGEGDAASRLNRIQPPADCVNGLSIGACNSPGEMFWSRAAYSSVGPGRRPGFVKPDGVVFGGTKGSPFWTLDSENPNRSMPATGTSVASPFGLRAGIGVRAHLGTALTPLAIRTLLIHSTQRNEHDVAEVGWGRICTDVEELLTCTDGAVRVVYQGKLEPKKFLRAEIPMLPHPMPGMTFITATICIATATDPDHPLAYTRSGLEVVFRPDKNNIKEEKTTARTAKFFKSHTGLDEGVLRSDAHKWEPVLHETVRKQGKTLKAPVFDIHYNPRLAGHDVSDDGAESLPYAMVITVAAPKIQGFYNGVVNKYRFRLQPLKPVIAIPVRT